MTDEDLGARRRAGRRLHLEPVVDPGIVAGGDDDAGGGAALEDLERAHLGRDGVDRVGDRDIVGGQDLGNGRREMLRREPPVVRDHHALRGFAAIDHIARDAVRAATHVLERELVGDPRPPPVRAEHDARRRRRLAGQGHLGQSSGSDSARSGARRPLGPGRRRAVGRSAVSRSMLPRSAGTMTPSRPPTRRTTRSSVSTSTVVAGLDDGARPAGTDRAEKRRP